MIKTRYYNLVIIITINCYIKPQTSTYAYIIIQSYTNLYLNLESHCKCEIALFYNVDCIISHIEEQLAEKFLK